MTACSRTYNFGQGMLAMHALSATARILTMAHHVRAQYSQARAITIRVSTSTTYLNDLSNQSTNHDHARPYFHSHNSKNAINNAPRKLPISQQSKSCWHWYMIYNCIYFQYNNAGLLQPFEDLSHQIHGRIQEPGPRPSSNTLVSNHLTIINITILTLILRLTSYQWTDCPHPRRTSTCNSSLTRGGLLYRLVIRLSAQRAFYLSYPTTYYPSEFSMRVLLPFVLGLLFLPSIPSQ